MTYRFPCVAQGFLHLFLSFLPSNLPLTHLVGHFMRKLALSQADGSQAGTEPDFDPVVHPLIPSDAVTATMQPVALSVALPASDSVESQDILSDCGVFPREMVPFESQRYAEGPSPTDAQPDRECLARKEVCDEILLSKTPPCTAGKDISNVGLEGFGNTSTSVDDTKWMPVVPFPPSMPVLSLPSNESCDAEMCEIAQIGDGTSLGVKCHHFMSKPTMPRLFGDKIGLKSLKNP